MCRGEIGYYLGGEFQNNGYMRRAVETLTDYAFKRWGYEELYGKVTKGNIASGKVLLKAGYTESGESGTQIIYTKKRQ